TYYYKIRAANAAGTSPYSNESSATTALSGASDIPIASLNTWLKADAGPVGDGGSASTTIWLDQSGNFNHASQLTSVPNEPTWVDNQANGRAVIRFNGINQYFNLSTSSGTEAFAVLKTTVPVPDDPHFLWRFGHSGSGGLTYPD